MIDDTKFLEKGINTSRTNLFTGIDEILKYQVVRAHAEHWSHDLRFLTFDDPELGRDDIDPAQSKDIEEDVEEIRSSHPITGQCQRCEPRHSGHAFESDFSVKSKDKEQVENCVHVAKLACSFCEQIPLFPNQGCITNFRIRRIDPKAWAVCRHFVAVSYCWTAQDSGVDGHPEAPYKVIEEDGSIRDTRASNSTINRVVDFARQNGYRMIWIDQECIEQDKPHEKELAVQAMDLVYLEAHISIGLLQSHLQQKHLDALLFIYKAIHTNPSSKHGRSAFRGPQSLDLATLAEAVSLIVNDGWNTRAWVLQEAFVSSGNMVLLFPRAKDIRTNGWAFIGHEMSLSEIGIPLDAVTQCVRFSLDGVSAFLKQQTLGAKPPNSAHTKPPVTNVASSELKTTLERIALFHPRQPRQAKSMNMRINTIREKRTCNAAVALTYLRLRDLYSISDKLAIVANMCGYALRLNTAKLGETQDSLGVCMIALSLCNGDFSLITPEVYRFPAKEGREDDSFIEKGNTNPEFSWHRAFRSQLAYVYSTSLNPQGNTASFSAGFLPTLSKSGLTPLGMIWKIDRYIDMHRLKHKYTDSWMSLNKNLAKTPTSTFRLGTTHLLFEIMRDLIAQNEIEAADAILNSTLSATWRTDKEGHVIESVRNLPLGLNVENRGGMFSLEPSDDGRFHQCWIIDRVMKKGGLWVGRTVPRQYLKSQVIRSTDRASESAESSAATTPSLPSKKHHSTPPARALDIDAVAMENTTDEAEHEGEKDLGSFAVDQTSVPTQKNDKPKLTFFAKGHQAQLRQFWLLNSLLAFSNNTVDTSKDGEVDPHSFATMKGDHITLFAFVASAPESWDKEVQDRRSIFDVDGDISGSCLVFQPFHVALEAIPRPETRSMSISWKIQRVGNRVGRTTDTRGDDGTEEDDVPSFTTHGSIKGMWKFNLTPGERVRLV